MPIPFFLLLLFEIHVCVFTKFKYLRTMISLTVILVLNFSSCFFPVTWLVSMCHLHYAAHWNHSEARCPDFSEPELETIVRYAHFRRKHTSILHLWNDYYREYLEVPFPRLIVRIEDLIFHPEETTRTVCECGGGSMREDGTFKYIVNSAKKGEEAHGKDRTGFVDAIVKYGSDKKRYQSYNFPSDLEYIRDNVDSELFNLMGYQPPDPQRAIKG